MRSLAVVAALLILQLHFQVAAGFERWCQGNAVRHLYPKKKVALHPRAASEEPQQVDSAVSVTVAKPELMV